MRNLTMRIPIQFKSLALGTFFLCAGLSASVRALAAVTPSSGNVTAFARAYLESTGPYSNQQDSFSGTLSDLSSSATEQASDSSGSGSASSEVSLVFASPSDGSVIFGPVSGSFLAAQTAAQSGEVVGGLAQGSADYNFLVSSPSILHLTYSVDDSGTVNDYGYPENNPGLQFIFGGIGIPSQFETLSGIGDQYFALAAGPTYSLDVQNPLGLAGNLGALTGSFNDAALFNFSISAAPEPSAWALMLLGIGGIGAALRMAKRRDIISVATT